MTPTAIQRLRALAEKATPKCLGDWYRLLVSVHSTGLTTQEQADYIASLDPATVIALCDLAEKAHPEPAQAQVSDAPMPKHGPDKINAALRAFNEARPEPNAGTRAALETRLHAVLDACCDGVCCDDCPEGEIYRLSIADLKTKLRALSAPLPDGRS